MNKNYKEKIREVLEALNKPTLFNGEKYYLKQACKDYLQSKGFTIVAPSSTGLRGIETIDMLIQFFYNVCNIIVPFSLRGLEVTPEKPHRLGLFRAEPKVDRKIAENFVKSRMEASRCDKESALQECTDIVLTVLDNIHLFNFTVPLSFYIFDQKDFYWVTKKAIDIVNLQGINDELKN